MTIDWKYRTINPYQKEWEDLTSEDKERFYRHNFIHRPDQIEKKLHSSEDPLLKVIRNFIPEGADENAALEELKKAGENRDKISKAGRKAAKNRKKI
jgi:hypothetical protein